MVGIGGINGDNLQYLQWMCNDSRFGVTLDGVAVISAIMSNPQPDVAATQLSQLWTSKSYPFIPRFNKASSKQPWDSNLLKQVVSVRPLVHHMTNMVVQTFSANMTLSFGASPIMSLARSEITDLSKICNALVLNIGTLNETTADLFITAIYAYNRSGVPIVFDPVGAGATKLRRDTTKLILESGYITILKGNESEIHQLAGDLITTTTSQVQRGVDSTKSDSTPIKLKAEIVTKLAQRYRTTVVQTGEIDIISNGISTYTLSNGHSLQDATTGAGCALSSIIAASIVASKDVLQGAITAVTAYNIAAERAVKRVGNDAPGSFVGAWVDEIHRVRGGLEEGDIKLVKMV